MRPTWLSDRDQFLKPTSTIPDVFKSDCLVWTLFHRCNRTAGADGISWGGKKWSLVNHFIPFTEDEVGATDPFESDFMVEYMKGLTISPEAQAVLDEGRILWRLFHTGTDPHTIRHRYFLNRPDAGWFQVRRALEERKQGSAKGAISFGSFQKAYEALTAKLAPQVYELGFLR